jgi:hypothetical protein
VRSACDQGLITVGLYPYRRTKNCAEPVAPFNGNSSQTTTVSKAPTEPAAKRIEVTGLMALAESGLGATEPQG